MNDTNSTQTHTAPTSTVTLKRTKFRLLIALVAILWILTLVGSYVVGFNKGKLASANKLKSSIQNLINPLNALSNNAIFPSSIIGKVNSIAGNTVKIKLVNGTEKTVVLSKNTKITRAGKEVSISELKKDTNVTVFVLTDEKTNKPSDKASSVILR